jgi:hypothetical protein
MPFVHEISEDDATAFVTARNPLDIDSFRRSITDLAGEPGFQPHFKILVDLRNMDFTPSNEEVRIIADVIGRMKEAYRSKVAVVVSGDLHFGLFRVASTYAEIKGFSMTVFRDLDEARAWLADF